MASKKVVKITKGLKKTVDNISHPPFLSTIIPAGQAMPAPPLGTQLGQVINQSRGCLLTNLGKYHTD